MKYEFKKDIYNDFAIYRQNTLPYRAYFTPFGSVEKLTASRPLYERYESDKVTILNGDWDFAYFDSVDKVPSIFDTSNMKFDKLEVPSCWQRKGYEPPVYVNARYIFNCTPPKIKAENSVGIYRLNLGDMAVDKNYLLTFLGVSGAYCVYVNGKYVGYCEGSHNSGEFDITSYLHDTDNEMVVVLYKWSNGTYLECQDMFRETGIFRDVLLTIHGNEYIYDYEFATKKLGDEYALELTTSVKNSDNTEIELSIFDGEKELYHNTLASSQNHKTKLKVEEWSAENPKLYAAIISLRKNGKIVESAREFIGFRDIRVNKNVYLWNDKAIKLLGVNHHDTNAKTGYVMTVDDYKLDVELMKKLNVNAVRTSHYPPDPCLIKLCDMYGLYVIDEADIETHGAMVKSINMISNNLAWKEHYLDRVMSMYYRDRNHACVCMWSLGNESGGIKCQDYCYDKLKQVTTIPVHYEAACRSRRRYYDAYSEMYTNVPKLTKASNKFGTKNELEKPYFLCEYCHSMGVGPGSFEDYMEAYLSSDMMLGGCVWEWADHAVYHENGKNKYTYGGDHGEVKHDSNFCCDGLVYPDRTLSTSAYAMGSAYRPLRASLIDNYVVLKNIRYFTDSADISITISILVDGVEVKKYDIDKAIKPQDALNTGINISEYKHLDAYVNLYYYDKKSSECIAKECIEIAKKIAILTSENELAIVADGENFVAQNDNIKVVFDSKGKVIAYIIGGKNILEMPIDMQFQIYRSAIDNYMNYDRMCKRVGMDKAVAIFTNATLNSGKLLVNYKMRLKLRYIDIKYTISVDSLGAIKYDVDLHTNSNYMGGFPKLGVAFTAPRKYENVSYYGYGDMENYIDMTGHTCMGIYEQKVDDFYTTYIKPQDNGNRYGVRWAKLTDSTGNGWRINAKNDTINFKADIIDNDSLIKAKHIEDVAESNDINVYVSGYMRGLGSNSCGPDVMKKYMTKFNRKHPYSFSFEIMPCEEK